MPHSRPPTSKSSRPISASTSSSSPASIPSHIIAPAIEKTAADVALLFSAVEGAPVEPELEVLAQTARRQLRRVFERADVGITGANFAVCETGIDLSRHERGQRRPRHRAAARPHRAARDGATRADARRSRRSAAAARAQRHRTGADDVHPRAHRTAARRERTTDRKSCTSSIVDNGRTGLLRGRYARCWRASAAARASTCAPSTASRAAARTARCTRDRWARSSLPLLRGLERAPALPHASSLCGACTAACPVKIPLHELLLDLRRDLVGEGIASRTERFAFSMWSLLWSRPARLSVVDDTRPASAGRSALSPGPGRVWAKDRHCRRSRGAATGTADDRARRDVRANAAACRLHRSSRRCARAGQMRPCRRAIYGVADRQRRPRRVAGGAARSLATSVRPRVAPARRRDRARAGRAVRDRPRRPAERTRHRHRPEPQRRHRADGSSSGCTAARGARRAGAALLGLHPKDDVVPRHRRARARGLSRRHRVQDLVSCVVVVFVLEEEDRERPLGRGVVERDELRRRESLRRAAPSSIWRCISSIRCLLTPSKDTTRASAIPASLSILGQPYARLVAQVRPPLLSAHSASYVTSPQLHWKPPPSSPGPVICGLFAPPPRA